MRPQAGAIGLFDNADDKNRARDGQQTYQIERRSSPHSELLILTTVLNIAPGVLVNHNLTGLSLNELRLLQDDADASFPGDLKAIAGKFTTATQGARNCRKGVCH
jgi:hypothetical protein